MRALAALLVAAAIQLADAGAWAHSLAPFAGTGATAPLGDGGPASQATFKEPAGLAVDAAGNVFVADTGNNRIRRIGADGIVSTVAGDGTAGYNGDRIAATQARLNAPLSVAVDAQGDLYIADTQNHRVRRVRGGVITTIAGTGVAGYNGDGPGVATQLNLPHGVAAGPDGGVYVADFFNNRVRRVLNGVVATVAGSGSDTFSGDSGPATAAGLR